MRTISILLILATAAIAAIGSCSPYSPSLPAAPFFCGSADPKCPDGYACMPSGSGNGVCVAPMGTIPVDGSQCADDSNLGPNQTLATAYQLPVDVQKKSVVFAGLAICPAGDKDYYAINISNGNENLEVLVAYESWGGVLQASILNATGVPIASAGPVSGVPGTIRAYTANLPVGTYHALVFGPASGTPAINNYKLTVTVTP